jgi:MFS family permease
VTDIIHNETAEVTRKPWQILTACSFILCINAAFPIYGASVINTEMVSQMGAERTLLGLLVSVNMIVTGLTAPLMGAFVGRVGARATLIGGSVLMIVGALAMALLVNSVVPAVLTFGIVFGLAMSAGGFVANQTCVAGWYKEDRARPFAILYATMGVGGFIATPLVSGAISSSGDWRSGWFVFAILGVIALLLSVFVIRDAPAADAEPQVGPAVEATGSGGIKSIPVWIVIFTIVVAGASSSMYIAHGLTLLNDFGHPASLASKSLGVMAASTLLGNFVIGTFTQKYGIRRILAGGGICFALGLVLLVNANTTILLFTYPVFLGAGFGAVQVGTMALLSKCVAPEKFPAAIGITLCLETLIAASSPFIGGYVFETLHTYMPMVMALVALNTLAAFILLVTGRLFPARA